MTRTAAATCLLGAVLLLAACSNTTDGNDGDSSKRDDASVHPVHPHATDASAAEPAAAQRHDAAIELPDARATMDTGIADGPDAHLPAPVCDTCAFPNLTWHGGFNAVGTYELTDCSTLTHTLAAGQYCDGQLACSETETSEQVGGSVAALQEALAEPAVQDALKDHTWFGGVYFASLNLEVSIGDNSFTVGFVGCDADMSCYDVPDAILRLQALLEAISAHDACRPKVVRDSRCEMPFDPGDGDESSLVYAFDSRLGICAFATYTGSGGNANRFEDETSCRASCPSSVEPDSCPAGRVFVAAACTACGPGGGCYTEALCAKSCKTDADCKDDYFDSCGPETHVCQLGAGCL